MLAESLLESDMPQTLPNKSHSAMSVAEAARYSTQVEDRWIASMRSGSRPSTAGKCVVDLRLHRSGAVKGLAEPGQPGVSVDADPHHVCEFFRPQRLD